MLNLQNSGCHNIEPVTPTPQVPLIMEALGQARTQGLTIPFIYNCGGYEDKQIIKMLDTLVDIYLPDFKYGREEDGRNLSAAPGYPMFALDALKEMVRQVGDGLETENGVAKKGIIVRHLVLPGHLENSREVFRLIKKKISTAIPVSLMAQYTPTPKVGHHPLLGRRITAQEYNQILDFALDLGFDNLFIQEVNDLDLAPDFNQDRPFEK
jgi:putative pyruvate formate lyase activating enzyme